jgi:hypothetical protein
LSIVIEPNKVLGIDRKVYVWLLKRLTLNLALVEANAFATLFCNYPYYGKVLKPYLKRVYACLPGLI